VSFRHNSTLAEGEPSWGSVDKSKLPRLAFADQGEADKKSSWKYPHHFVKNGGGEDEDGVYTTGTMYLHEGGLDAAWSAANGGRSGKKASAEVIAHLQAHREALKKDGPAGLAPLGAPRCGLRAIAQGATGAQIDLYGIIGWDVTAADFVRGLKGLGDVSQIDLHLHSPGGFIMDGLAIHNRLKNHPAKVVVHVDGMALSMASIVAMAGDESEMCDHSLMMIHNPLAQAYGDAEDLREEADLLDVLKNELVSIYAERTGRGEEEIAQLMDQETWFTAGDACERGFADRTSSQPAIAASFDARRFKNVPHRFFFQGALSMPVQTEALSVAEEAVPAAPAASAADPVAIAEQPPAKSGKDFLAAFGAQGAVWFVEGKSWDDAQALHAGSLQKQIDELNAKLGAVDFGQRSPVSAGDVEPDPAKGTAGRGIPAAMGGNIGRVAAGIRLPKPSHN
jgi:ATP-dependent Clp endopeptidase proteolytic subunit ClpP